jgi:hypothetical protein
MKPLRRRSVQILNKVDGTQSAKGYKIFKFISVGHHNRVLA